MIEFIVSGQIPGTHIQITFNTVVAIAAAVLVAAEVILGLKLHLRLNQSKNQSDKVTA